MSHRPATMHNARLTHHLKHRQPCSDYDEEGLRRLTQSDEEAISIGAKCFVALIIIGLFALVLRALGWE